MKVKYQKDICLTTYKFPYSVFKEPLQTKVYNSRPSCMVGPSGLEPPTSRLSGVRSNQLSYEPIKPTTLIQHKDGGDEEDRTPDPLRARQVLSQLSYTPEKG